MAPVRDFLFVGCEAGHDWQSIGGRACPYADENLAAFCTRSQAHRTQTVYRCGRCGEWDYGERGGPGHADCVLHCGAPL